MRKVATHSDGYHVSLCDVSFDAKHSTENNRPF